MLCLISIGIHDEKDMSMKALEAAKKCSRLYLELYTDNIATSTEKLSKLIGKDVEELLRSGMEDCARRLVSEAKSKDVGILVGGDALSATTHIMLVSEARKAGVAVRVIHGSSIMTAVAETGLQIYKFGRTVTLTRGFEKSILDGIKSNMKAGLHTLVLLDIGMTAKEAVSILSNRLDKKTMAVAACRIGGNDSVIRYGSLKQLAEDNSIDNTPAVVALPGKLHFMEEEYLQQLSSS
jgi:diphthine synthase